MTQISRNCTYTWYLKSHITSDEWYILLDLALTSISGGVEFIIIRLSTPKLQFNRKKHTEECKHTIRRLTSLNSDITNSQMNSDASWHRIYVLSSLNPSLTRAYQWCWRIPSQAVQLYLHRCRHHLGCRAFRYYNIHSNRQTANLVLTALLNSSDIYFNIQHSTSYFKFDYIRYPTLVRDEKCCFQLANIAIDAMFLFVNVQINLVCNACLAEKQ